MLDKIQFEKILFLDIETVPQTYAYQDLDEKIRNEFEEKGVITVRNYAAPNAKSKFNLFELKSWEQMFLTTDKEKIAWKCEENGIEY
jgi:hypothetical protein